MENIKEAIEVEVKKNKTLHEIKQSLLDKGFLEHEVNDAVDDIEDYTIETHKHATRSENNIFTIKELFDRVGYGFVAIQFVNILFFLSGAGFFFVGMINGFKDIISAFVGSLITEYGKIKKIGTGFISKSGIMFGFSFLIVTLAVVLKQPWLFAISLIAGAIGVVTYGQLSRNFINSRIKKERRSHFLRNIAHYGLLITFVSFLLSGFLMTKFPLGTSKFNGVVLSFEIGAILFIISGFILSFFKDEELPEKHDIKRFLKNYFLNIQSEGKVFFQNKFVFLMFITSSILGIIHSLSGAYFGYFVYETFKQSYFTGFMNVAIIFSISIPISLIGPSITKSLNKNVGLAPSFVFGTLLVALMPLVLVFNPSFPAVIAANAASVLGGSIIGIAQGLLARKLMHEEERKKFFNRVLVATALPFIFLVPIGALIAEIFGPKVLFNAMSIILVAIVAPIYFILVIFANNKRY